MRPYNNATCNWKMSKNILQFANMESPTCKSLSLLSQNPTHNDFNSLFNHLNTFLSSPNLHPHTNTLQTEQNTNLHHNHNNTLKFSSTSISLDTQIKKFTSRIWPKPAVRDNPLAPTLFKNLTVLERSLVGAGAGAMAGAFTYVCLHPLDTIKTKMQTQGASEIYTGAIDAVIKTFQSRGIMGFYSGVSAVIVGSAASSAVYFGTCEFGKSILTKLPEYPALLIPPTASAMGNILSSAIMVPKELITQRMQAGAKGKSWEVLLRILEKDGILGLYAGYSATLLRNLPAGVLSYSSFEYLKAAVLNVTNEQNMEPVQSVCCGALAGAISATLTTPLDVIKTRLMTQINGAGGVSGTVKQILRDEGLLGFSRGMGPRVLHSACFSALGFFALETAKLMILHHYLLKKEVKETCVDPKP